MRCRYSFWTTALLVTLLAPAVLIAQGTAADYERANSLRVRYEGLTVNVPGPAGWIDKTHRFWYRKSVKGGSQFVVFDAETLQKRPAFDHPKLAASLSETTGKKYTSLTLPFTVIAFADNEKSLQVTFDGTSWKCSIADYSCKKAEPGEFGGGRGGRGGAPFQGRRPENDKPRPSPDKKWEALINNFNIAVRAAGAEKLTHLSLDGSESNSYELSSIAWSPDSKKIAAYRVKPGYRREVHYVESSPEDQLQPKYSSILYGKPGDVLDIEQPVLFDVEANTQTIIDNTLFRNAYAMSRLEWRKDSRAFTFEYNQRGHQVYRVIEVDSATGEARAVISEEPKTFFNYLQATGILSGSGKKYRYDVSDGKEVIWMSERDGWNHLYLYDGAAGTVKNQVTKGNWVVRGVVKVDEEKRQIWFSASGMYPEKDPYFLYYYRINFDGSGLTRLTDAEANHSASFSSDKKYFVDTYSRIDTASVSELRRLEDGSLMAEVEHGVISDLVKGGWKAPEVFVAKGRDSQTDIWGIIIKPTNFEPAKKYPVIENIYAGPQGSFVPKSFAAFNQMMAQAELGFVVVQIDGMGTSNRSKAFHDVAWKNLGDAGFPDRILWHKAVAAKYSWYDITRVGIYGNSAGGQSSLGGLLFHPEFYKAAVSSAGCHDNRMDKIWWNEQWMGWPIGPEYAAASNVDNAYRLRGHLLLVVGEMDTNVDPSSTMQVVNQLIKHNKDFDLLYIPGAGHGPGGAYGEHKRFDFFVRHLLGAIPPAWTDADRKATRTEQAEEP